MLRDDWMSVPSMGEEEPRSKFQEPVSEFWFLEFRWLAQPGWEWHVTQEGEWRMGKVRTFVLLAGGFLASSGLGCYPFSMGIFTPVPVPPWVTERMQDKYCTQNDSRPPLLPPIRDGYPPP